MNNTIRRLYALFLALLLALSGTAMADDVIVEDLMILDEDLPEPSGILDVAAEEIELSVLEIEDIILQEPEDVTLGDCGLELDMGESPQTPTPFDQQVQVGDVTIRVTAGAGAFPEGAILSATVPEDAMAQSATESIEAVAKGVHHLYCIEIMDAAGNLAVPDPEIEPPVVRVSGLGFSDAARVVVYDRYAEQSHEIDAHAADGTIRFNFADSAIYDVIEKVAEEEQPTEEQPAEEDQPPEEQSTEEQPTDEDQPTEEQPADTEELVLEEVSEQEGEALLLASTEALLSTEETVTAEAAYTSADEPFSQFVTIGGVTVTLSAAAGMFPAGVKLSVGLPSSNERQAQVESAVASARDKGTRAARTHVFNIRVVDDNGTAQHPASGSVGITFDPIPLADDPNLTAAAWRVSDKNSPMKAAALSDVDVNGQTVSVAVGAADYADFNLESLYAVQLCYAAMNYVLPNGETVPLDDILWEVGLYGEVDNAYSSNDALFSAVQQDGEWVVVSHSAFYGSEALHVVISGVDYEIDVVSDQPSIPYLDLEGHTQTHDCVLIDSDTTEWKDGKWYAATESLDTYSRIQVNGNVNLILCDNIYLRPFRGIHVSKGNSLTIWGNGKLIISAAAIDNAGIGGDSGEDGGTINININSGFISAYGGGENQHGGAGIGGGYNGNGGIVTVARGRLACQGGSGAAGIGGGRNGSGGQITITGGHVETHGGDLGAAIGGGANGAGGHITISGGRVYVYGGSDGAGIGSGDNGGDGGVITITGGEIYAKGYSNGAVIGGGNKSGGGEITITGGTISASIEGIGTGIGGGIDSGSAKTDINIKGGYLTVTSKGTWKSDGISGYHIGTSPSADNKGSITISGGKIIVASIGGNGCETLLTYEKADSQFSIQMCSNYAGHVRLGKPFKENFNGYKKFYPATSEGQYADNRALGDAVYLGPAVYKLDIKQAAHCTVTADKTKAIVGDTVTLTVNVDSDYVLKPSFSPEVKYDIKEDYGQGLVTLTFAMPFSDVTFTPNAVSEWSLLQEGLDWGSAQIFWPTVKASDYDKNENKHIVADDADRPLKMSGNFTLDLMGCTLDRGLTKKGPRADGYVLKVEGVFYPNNDTIRLKDSVGGGKLTGGYNTQSGGGVVVSSGAALYFEGGSIVNNRTSEGDGGGVYLQNSAILSIFGGVIASNVSMKGNGGGVYASKDAQVDMVSLGSEIYGNSATNGGGVYLTNSYFTSEFENGSIYRNTATVGNGGGIYIGAKNSVTVEKNMAIGIAGKGNMAWAHGGGVYVSKGSTCIVEGSVTDNYTRGGNGSGVYVEGELTVKGNASITGNKAGAGNRPDLATTDTLVGKGGGVYVEGRLIARDSAAIKGNAAKEGGGVFVDGTFEVKDAANITGNAAGSAGNNVLLNNNRVVTVTGKMSGASIGVTTVKKPTEKAPVTITSGMKSKGKISDPTSVFFSDDPAYSVMWNSAQTEAVLGLGPSVPHEAASYSAVYDGKAHGISVTVKDAPDAKIEYSTDGKNYSATNPAWKDVGEHTVYYRITAPKMSTVTGSAKVSITPASAKVVADNQVMTTKDPVPKLTAKVKGLKGDDKSDVIKYSISLPKGTDTKSAWTYDIIVTGEERQGNYTVTFVNGKLTVVPYINPWGRAQPPVQPDYTLLATLTSIGHHALKLTWTKVDDAQGYDVFYGKCGDGFRRKTVTGGTCVRLTGLKKRTAYHAYVKAWKKVKGVKTYIGKASSTVHAITGGYNGKYTNASKVTIRTPKVKLAVGKTSAIRASVQGVRPGRKVLAHEKALRYYSSDRNVATVTSAGIIKAKGVGSCTVYVMANNGVRASVKVTVPDYPSKISFKKSSYSVKKGKKLKLAGQIKLTPSGVTTDYTWYSSDPDIATVSSKGVVKGVKKGALTIAVYTSNGKMAYTTVKVK